MRKRIRYQYQEHGRHKQERDIRYTMSIHSTCSSSSHELVPNKGKCGGRRATCQWTKSSVAAFLWSMIIKHKTQPKEPTNIIAELFRTTCGKNCAACARTCTAKRQGSMDWRASRPRFPVSNTGIMGCLHSSGWPSASKSAMGTRPWPCNGGHH